MSSKYYRTGLAGKNASVAPSTLYSTQSPLFPLIGGIDCSGFTADLLSLIGDRNDPYYADIGPQATGKLRKEKNPITYYSYEREYCINPQEKGYKNMKPEDQIKFMETYAKAGTIMGWIGSGPNGHVWISTGEFHYTANGKIDGLFILESEGYYNYGTVKRWLPLSDGYFTRMNALGRPGRR